MTQNGYQPEMVAQQSAYEEVLIAQYLQAGLRVVQHAGSADHGGPGGRSQVATWQLQFIQSNYGSPSQYVWASAVAPYVQLPSGDNVAGLTVNQIFTDLNQDLTDDVIPWIQGDAAVANSFGVRLAAYEGGQDLVPGANDLNYGVMAQAQNDPRMYQLYLAIANAWTQNGGGLYEDFHARRRAQ